MTADIKQVRTMAGDRRDLAGKLDFFDVNVWLGKPDGFPLAHEIPAGELPGVMLSYFIREALVSHWDSRTISARTGNLTLDTVMVSLPKECLSIAAGLPLFPAEEGLLPGSGMLPVRTAGIRLFPKSHGFPLAEWMTRPLCAWLSERHMPLFVQHTEIDWSSLRMLAKAFPDLPVVVESQVQKILYHTRPLFALMRECPNVFVETSNFVGQGLIEYAVHEFGAHRLLFGSFLPVNDPLVAIGMIVDAGISEEDKRLIAGGNIRRIIRSITP